jgi:hypothetical protein
MVVLVGAFPGQALAFPLEMFDHRVEVSCAESSSCARSLRAKTTLGAYTGIWIRGGDDMRSTLEVKQGSLHVEASGTLLSGVQLSWDSDTYPDQLSSAGLKCIDMRHQEGTAIIIKDFELDGECGENDAERACPPFTLETRIYDSADPTGQTYSASILRRPDGKERQDLIIPFSNFNRRGLRGEGRLGCAGAVSINVRTDGYRSITLKAGQIFTDSSEPLEALVLTPTPTSVPATPLAKVERSQTPEPSASPRSDTPTPEIPISVATPVKTARESEGAEESPGDTPPSARGSEVIVAPLNSPVPRQEEEEEMVFGSIVSE